jgi:hypothetical protein
MSGMPGLSFLSGEIWFDAKWQLDIGQLECEIHLLTLAKCNHFCKLFQHYKQQQVSDIHQQQR